MQVSVDVGERPGADARALTLATSRPPSPLVHEAHLGTGVHLRVDLLAPRSWLALSLEVLDDVSAPLVADMVGESAMRALRTGGVAGGVGSLVVDRSDSAPWLRVAAVDALDRWLQLPLNQSLIDAERGVARMHAAAGLPADSAARRLIVGDALRLARSASGGVVRHLRELGLPGVALPRRLHAALNGLAADYDQLAAEVSGPDHELAAVRQVWKSEQGSRLRRRQTRPMRRSGWERPAARNPIDPRLVPARLVGVSTDLGAAELYPVTDPGAGGDAVRVEVLAFAGRDIDEDRARRLLVRVSDRDTADPLGYSPLTLVPGRRSAARRWFQAVLPLAGRSVTNVRADVYDVLSGPPPVVRAADPSLRGARCATAFLGEWRRIVAMAWVAADGNVLGERVRDLAEHLHRAEGETGAPAFPGCPPVERILEMADLIDPSECLRAAGADDPYGDEDLGFASGVGRPLVAELVAAPETWADQSGGGGL